MAKKRSHTKKREDRSPPDAPGRPPWRRSATSPLVTENDRALAAFALGNSSYWWEYICHLSVEARLDDSMFYDGLQDALVTLADEINPGVLLELHRVMDAILQQGLHALKTLRGDRPADSSDIGHHMRSQEEYFDWFHSLIKRTLPQGSTSAHWCRLGGAIGAVQTAVFPVYQDPSIRASEESLDEIVEAACTMGAQDACAIPELKEIAKATRKPTSGKQAGLLVDAQSLV